MIRPHSPLEQVAAVVSQTLREAGISAVLSGGAAVSTYTDNLYESSDLDFVCSAESEELEKVMAGLGFERAAGGKARMFTHPNCRWFVEFPPGPLSFGATVLEAAEVTPLETDWGPLSIITPTQCVMDRLAAYAHWHDQPSMDQAVMVARARDVDWRALEAWAKREGTDLDDFRRRLSVERS